MSGIEVAGLVLGSIPLLISALEHYGQGVSTIERWWKYKRELAGIKRLLLAEQSVFQGTIERLLEGVVPGPELEDLLENAGKDLWRKQDFAALNEKLSRRLGRSYGSFDECVESINQVVGKLKADLELREDGKPEWAEGASFIKQLKRIQFTLSRSSYMESLYTIEKNNNLLTTLLTQNLELEPLRKRRSGPRALHNKVESTARAIYDAVDSCWGSSCTSSHTVRIALEPRLEEMVDAVTFRLVFDSHQQASLQLRAAVIWEALPTSSMPDANCLTSTTSPPQTPANIKPLDDKGGFRARLKSRLRRRRNSISDVHATRPESISGGNASKPSQDRVKFATPGPSTSDNIKGQDWAVDTGAEITDLCSTLSTAPSTSNSATPVGYISNRRDNATSRYILYSSSVGYSPATRLHLESILGLNASPKVSRGERYAFALTIASSVLQLGSTDFMPQIWTKHDIIVYPRNKDSNSTRSQHTATHATSIDNGLSAELYIERMFPKPPASQGSSDIGFTFLRNPSIFRLGIVLIELCLGQTLESLYTTADPLDANGKINIMTEWSIAARVLNEVSMEAGHRYGDAVRRCIYCDFDQRSSSLENNDFRQALYNGVVAPLEDIWRDFSGA